MSDKKWEPLSIEEAMCKIYPDQFHILENYGRSDHNEEQYLTNVNASKKTSATKNILPAPQFSIKIMPSASTLSDDDDDDDDIRLIKELELNEREQIKAMRNIGLTPDINSYVNSDKTFPCIINGRTRKQNKGPPIILDDDFFNVSTCNKNNLKMENLETNLNISSTSNETTMTTLTSDISSVSLSSKEDKSSLDNVPLKTQQKSIYDILKIARIPPPKEDEVDDRYNKNFPALKADKKKRKKKISK